MQKVLRGSRPRREVAGRGRLVLSAIIAALALAPATAQGAIRVLSSRADTVSGDDALIAVTLPKGVRPSDVKVVVGGVDESSAFKPKGGDLVGLL